MRTSFERISEPTPKLLNGEETHGFSNATRIADEIAAASPIILSRLKVMDRFAETNSADILDYIIDLTLKTKKRALELAKSVGTNGCRVNTFSSEYKEAVGLDMPGFIDVDGNDGAVRMAVKNLTSPSPEIVMRKIWRKQNLFTPLYLTSEMALSPTDYHFREGVEKGKRSLGFDVWGKINEEDPDGEIPVNFWAKKGEEDVDSVLTPENDLTMSSGLIKRLKIEKPRGSNSAQIITNYLEEFHRLLSASLDKNTLRARGEKIVMQGGDRERFWADV